MRETKANNFLELHNALSKYKRNNQWLFRGQADIAWKLLPKAGREFYNECSDKDFFTAWKRKAKEFIDIEKYNDWDLLAIAQHHGLATRLLDWTYNPLIAAFFATEKYLETDAVIYAYRNPKVVSTESISPFDKYDSIGKFKPNGASQRISRQSAIFTIHFCATLPLENNLDEDCNLEKIIIDKQYRKELPFELSYYGINKASVFPDLDGLCNLVNWYMENRNYWDGKYVEDFVASDIID